MNVEKNEQDWVLLQKNFSLSADQLEALKVYAYMLQAWNKNINVTAIEDTQQIIADHFQDSLTICRYVNFKEVCMIADVGSGGGFPGLPLKIMFDHLELVIIEVNHKKLQFLQAVIDALKLKHVYLYDLDWRTFLRQVNLPIELFLARASLQPGELLRIFKANSPYNHAQLVYWASQHWQADRKLMPYVSRDESYQVGEKKRRYIFFEGNKRLI